MYSTASFDISSRAFWYSFIFLCISLPVILIIIKNERATGIRLIRPSLQSNMNRKASITTGVAIEPALSGSWWARYVSVAAGASVTAFLSLPLPIFSIVPIGSFVI